MRNGSKKREKLGESLWEDEEEDVSSYWIPQGKKRILEIERGSTRSFCAGNGVGRDYGPVVR
jgi:hypothetical protein